MDAFGRSYTMDIPVHHRTIRVTVDLSPSGGYWVTMTDPDLTYADGPPTMGLNADGAVVSIANSVPPEHLYAAAQVLEVLTAREDVYA